MFAVSLDAIAEMTIEYASADPAAPGFGGSPPAELKNVTVDMGKFFDRFIDPIMGEMRAVLLPMKPALDFLTLPIPIVCDLLVAFGSATGGGIQRSDGETATVLDLAFALEPPSTFAHARHEATRRSVDLAKAIVDYETPDFESYHQVIGDFRGPAYLGTGGDWLGTQQVNALEQLLASPGEAASFLRQFEAQPASQSVPEVGFTFPLLEDPRGLLGLVSGREDVDLFRANFAASIAFETDFDIPVYSYGPFGISLNLGFGDRKSVV